MITKERKKYPSDKDPFKDITDEICMRIKLNPFPDVKKLLNEFQLRDPSKYKGSMLRSLERRIKFYREEKYSIERMVSWLVSLNNGGITCSELIDEFKNLLTLQDIILLNDCILTKPLKLRCKATVVFAHLYKIPNACIASFCCCSYSTITNYINEYYAKGVVGLLDTCRGKVFKTDDPNYINEVFKILHEPPSLYGINRTSWKMDDIHRVMSDNDKLIGVVNIRKIIKNAGYKLLKAKKVLTSSDPLYRDKLKVITNILKSLKPNQKFFSIDEFGPFAVKRQGGRSLVEKGQRRIYPQRQKSKGTIIVTAALELSTNQITHFYSEKKNTVEMIKLLDLILKQYHDDDCIYFSWDAASWHASKKLFEKVKEVNKEEYRRLNGTPQVCLAPLPACAQFLNVIESIFSGMARAIIHNSDYESVDECKKAIDRYFQERNLFFIDHPQKAGKKIWGKEVVPPCFHESNNCKNPHWR